MQKILELTDAMTRDINAKRKWVRDHYIPEKIKEYDTVEGKLVLLDTILKSNWIDKNEVLKWQCLGITFGDLFVQEMNFKWVQVEDEYGTDPAIQLPDTGILLFPLTMISKRMETVEDLDIYSLYEGLKLKLQEIVSES